MNLQQLQKEIHEISVSHGFWESGRGFAECIALIHSELSEALEEDRIGNKTGVAEELADTVIRILDLAESQNMNLEQAIQDKHIKNKNRPYKHGKLY